MHIHDDGCTTPLQNVEKINKACLLYSSWGGLEADISIKNIRNMISARSMNGKLTLVGAHPAQSHSTQTAFPTYTKGEGS